MGGLASHLAGSTHSARKTSKTSKTARCVSGGVGSMGGGVGGGMGGGVGGGMGGGVAAVGVATPRDGPIGTPRPSYLAALVQAG